MTEWVVQGDQKMGESSREGWAGRARNKSAVFRAATGPEDLLVQGVLAFHLFSVLRIHSYAEIISRTREEKETGRSYFI